MKFYKQFIAIILSVFILSVIAQKVMAANKSFFISQNKVQINTSVSYDVTISETDIVSAQSLNPSCPIITWTLNTGYGKNDSEAIDFASQGSTNNTELPITQYGHIFGEQNGYDILYSNGFDRVMPVISFFGTSQSCEIRYPISSRPILFSEFPYTYPAVPTSTP